MPAPFNGGAQRFVSSNLAYVCLYFVESGGRKRRRRSTCAAASGNGDCRCVLPSTAPKVAREAARRELQQRVKSDWRLMLQPFKPYALPALGTLSWLTLTLTLDLNPSLILTLP